MTDKSKIVEKIKKLLSLAKRNSSVEEAASAAAKAQSLMEEYRIHQAMLTDNKSSMHRMQLNDQGQPQQWKAFLASLLASANGCCIVQSSTYEKDNKVLIIGETSDIEIVQELYSYIRSELQELCVLKILSVRKDQGFFPRSSYAKSFFVGALHVIKDRLEQVKKTVRTKAQTNLDEDKLKDALAKIDSKSEIAKAWASNNLDLTVENVTLKNDDEKGYSAGVDAGKKIDLNNTKKLT